MKHLFFALVSACLLVLTGCETTSGSRSGTVDRAAIHAAIQAEEPGDYWVGRRYFKQEYHFWGYVRRPRQPWSTAKMVVLNEQKKLAPDRAMGLIGSDSNYEYKLQGYFSGDTVYEPASNGFYPEFVLTDYTVKSISPIRIYANPAATDPTRRVIEPPVR
ncbi:MAG TPA: hypothetical protein VF585_03885 [Chthoniobacterales bacterium]|jgi:hypothetical protein